MKRTAVVVFAGLALLAGTVAGCGGAADRANDDRGSGSAGPDYFQVEEVRVDAAAPEMLLGEVVVFAPATPPMLDEVLITAPGPEWRLEEVVVGERRRPADTRVIAGSAASTGSGSREL